MYLLILLLVSWSRHNQTTLHKYAYRWESYSLAKQLARFPGVTTTLYWKSVGENHLAWLDQRMRLFPMDRADLWRYRQQVRQYTDAWKALYYAHYHSGYDYSNTSLKYNLDNLHKYIGDDNYYAGVIYYPIAPWYRDDDTTHLRRAR